MAKFVVGRPLTTREPVIEVDAGLPPGVHRFELVIVGASGLKSPPDQVLVQVRATTVGPVIRPTPLQPQPQPLTPLTPRAPRTPRRKGNRS